MRTVPADLEPRRHKVLMSLRDGLGRLLQALPTRWVFRSHYSLIVQQNRQVALRGRREPLREVVHCPNAARPPRKHVVFFDSYLVRNASKASERLAVLRAGLDAEAFSCLSHGVSVWIERNRKQELEESFAPDEQELTRIIGRLSSPDALMLDQERYWRLMRGGTLSIDVQRPSDAVADLNRLKLQDRTDVLVMMTIHGPDERDRESLAYWRDRAVPKALLERLHQSQHTLERIALQGAPVWIFADQGAQDLCLQRHPDHREWSVNPGILVLALQDDTNEPVSIARAYVDRIAAILDRHESATDDPLSSA